MRAEIFAFEDTKLKSLGVISIAGQKVTTSSALAKKLAETGFKLGMDFLGKDPDYAWSIDDLENFLKALAFKYSGALFWVELVSNTSKAFFDSDLLVESLIQHKILKVIPAWPTVKVIVESEDEQGGEKWWAEHWHECFPKSGQGKFVFQHHFMGLAEEESKLSEEELLQTTHSIHGDLRHKFNDLFGFTTYLGKTSDVRAAQGNRLANLGSNEKLQGTWKLLQPDIWLRIASKKPFVVAPGDVGATTKTYAKFFEIDDGDYSVGVWRLHSFEIFYSGKEIKGRYLITYAPIGGRRIWVIGKPKSQNAYADTHNQDEVIEELRSKGQAYLLWSKPGMTPELIKI